MMINLIPMTEQEEREYWIARAELAATDPAQWSAKELKNVLANLLRYVDSTKRTPGRAQKAA